MTADTTRALTAARNRILRAAAILLLFGPPLLWARPEFLMRYAADPFSRPERRSTCATCHINPAGGGPRDPFGLAFARNGFRVTPELRAQWPDRFLPSVEQQPADVPPGSPPVKATWAAAHANEVLIEIAGEKYLLDNQTATITKVGEAQAQAFVASSAAAPAANAVVPSEVPREIAGRIVTDGLPATFDFYLVNLPTTKPRAPRSLQMRFSHRFSDAAFAGTNRAGELFGLDSIAIPSLGVEYGINKYVSFVTYRTPYARVLGGPTIEMGPVFALAQQSARVPFSAALKTTVEGEYNFTERYTVNLVPEVSHAFGTRAEFFVAPILNFGVPRRTLNAFAGPQRTPGELRDNAVALGVGLSIRIRPRTAIIGEYMPRLAGYRAFGSENVYSFGIQRATQRHVFALVFSNSYSTTTTRMLTDGLDDVRIGFNIYRRLF